MILDKETQWVDKAVRSVLISLWVDFPKLSPKIAESYVLVLHIWGYGRRIHLDCLIIQRPDKNHIKRFITTISMKGLKLAQTWVLLVRMLNSVSLTPLDYNCVLGGVKYATSPLYRSCS